MPAAVPRSLRALILVGAACLLALSSARAHTAFESSAVVRLQGPTLELEVVMARTTAAAVALPASGLVLLGPENFEQHRANLSANASRVFTATSAGAELQPLRSTAVLTEEQDVVFTLHYAAPAIGAVRFKATHLASLGPDYSSTFIVAKPGQPPTEAVILNTSYPEIEVTLGGLEGLASPTAPAGFRAFFVLGIEHILTGYDHLLFLAGLLVACRQFRSMVAIITCFTLAHSITLALASLGVLSLPGHIVEPLIAASIVFIGIENLVRQGEPKGRWALTFIFGLIHGFGFAGVLQEIGLGAAGTSIALPLFSFNLGVELGQLAVMALVLPLLLWWRQRPSYERVAQPAASWLVAGAGAYWFLQRTLFA